MTYKNDRGAFPITFVSSFFSFLFFFIFFHINLKTPRLGWCENPVISIKYMALCITLHLNITQNSDLGTCLWAKITTPARKNVNITFILILYKKNINVTKRNYDEHVFMTICALTIFVTECLCVVSREICSRPHCVVVGEYRSIQITGNIAGCKHWEFVRSLSSVVGSFELVLTNQPITSERSEHISEVYTRLTCL